MSPEKLASLLVGLACNLLSVFIPLTLAFFRYTI